MKANLLIKLLIIAAVIAVGLVVLRVSEDAGSSIVIDQPYMGMGDLHRFENEGFIRGSTPTPKPYYGMGDLRQLENLQETQFPE